MPVFLKIITIKTDEHHAVVRDGGRTAPRARRTASHRIVTELGTGARCVHELVESLDAPQPLISQHLRVLRGAGVVQAARRGREMEYTLTDEHIAHIVADAV